MSRSAPWRIRASMLLATGLLVAACGRTKVSAVPRVPPKVTPATLATLPAGATATAAQHENAAYLMRRHRDPPVIGGCEEACETPQRAVSHLLDALVGPDREALRRSFDWSILVVDGEALGQRWGEMWGHMDQQAARKADIARWLQEWTAWLAQIEQPDGLARARVGGALIKPIAGRTDVVEMTFRHPKLKVARGEAIWRFEFTRRGWEWLISRIDHSPSRPRMGASPQGSPAPGRL